MEPQYFYNTKQDRVIPANPVMRAYAANKSHLVPCDEDGNKVGTETNNTDAIASLKRQLAEMESERNLLREQVARLQGEEDPLKSQVETGEPVVDPGEDVNKADALVDAIGKLQEGHPDHFTSAGLPKVEALEIMSGFQEVSAAERDEAWERYNQGN